MSRSVKMRPLRRALVVSTVALSMLLAWAGPAHAQDWISVTGPGSPIFAGGDFSWHLDVWAPVEAPPVVTAAFDWGDGSNTVITSDAGLNGEGGGFYWADAGHVYAQQGFYDLRITVSQEGSEDQAYTETVVVWGLNNGGSVKGSGTVWARSGGMYDQDFAGGTAAFKVSAKRRSGTTATTVSLTVSVPSMTPDWPPGGTTGMTFNGTAALYPLYVDRASGEIWLERVYGTVANSAGSAGTAFATFHAVVKKGQPTLVRISIWNSSAGFTIVDTGWLWDQSYYNLDSTNDRLVSGSLKIG